MITQTLNGKALGQQWLVQVAAQVKTLPRAPRLVVVQVGAVAASSMYVQKKLEAAAAVGILAEKLGLPTDISETALMNHLHALAHDAATDAILMQTPLPEGMNTQKVLDALPWRKDVDGLSAASAARRAQGLPCHLPATPAAIVRVITEAWGHSLQGLSVAVIGNGRVVGAPLRAMLAQAGAQVMAIDRDTPHPQALTKQARVVIAACGVPGLVNAHWLSQGADVIDVGLTPEPIENGTTRLRGDVEVLSIEGVAARRTPAPGGIGPLTVAQLLANVANASVLR
jgi:methylenetetrahydrofolate dehydrogenase (NADP+)/methenyltetrahydrofolate cyclohydrolase